MPTALLIGGGDDAADMRAVTEEVACFVAVVNIFLDRVLKIFMSLVDPRIQDGNVDCGGIGMLADEPTDGAQAPLAIEQRIGLASAQPSVGNRLDEVHGS